MAGAIATAQAWVAQIDAGLYDQSYAESSAAMQEKVSQEKWDVVLKTLRPPWGGVVSRVETSHVLKPDGLEGLSGECVVITYDTAFKKLDPAMEVVVLKWEGGKWRGAGYNVGPKPLSPGEAPIPPQSLPQTDTSDTTTKTPNQ